jgi:hypothetical protein
MAYVLWTRFLRHNPVNPHWSNRDRFVLSAGHGSALLYSLLHVTGYDLPLDQIKQFRQWGSIMEMKCALPLSGAVRGCVHHATVPTTRPARDSTARIIPQRFGVAVSLESTRILWQR